RCNHFCRECRAQQIRPADFSCGSYGSILATSHYRACDFEGDAIMLDPNVLGLLLPIVIAAALIALFLKKGKPVRVNLMEYQRGVLYKKGLPVKEVGGGSHWVWSGTQKLIHADTRPRSVGYEKQLVALQDGSSAVYGFLASVQMKDVRKAIYS